MSAADVSARRALREMLASAFDSTDRAEIATALERLETRRNTLRTWLRRAKRQGVAAATVVSLEDEIRGCNLAHERLKRRLGDLTRAERHAASLQLGARFMEVAKARLPPEIYAAFLAEAQA